MPYPTPALTTLIDQIQSDILNSGNLPNGLLPNSVYEVVGMTQAEMAYLHTEYLRYMALQVTPATATDEYLDMWGALKAITRQAAEPSITTAKVTGVSTTILPSGFTAQVNGSTIGFVSTSAATITNGVALVPMAATTAGSDTNFGANTALTMVNSIYGANTAMTLYTAATGGSDIETDNNYRLRILAAFQSTGSTGSNSNYLSWTKEVPGVTRAWVNPWGMGDGTVVIYAMMDTQNSLFNGFLQGSAGVATNETRWATKATGDCLTIANYIFPLQPLGLVYVTAPIQQALNITIGSLSISATTSVQSAILASLQSLILSLGSPLGCTITVSQIDAAIQAAVGSATFTLISPSSNITTSTGYLPIITGVTYV